MSIPVPEHITRVDGCSCRGMEMHEVRCSIWDLDPRAREVAVDDARQRLTQHVADLNATLRPIELRTQLPE
jgi:hypothetical protein